MTHKFRTKDFEELKAKWYSKLKKDGFADIEKDESRLKRWDSQEFVTAARRQSRKGTEKYYQLAGQFLYSNEFKSKKEKLAWEMHSNGQTIREISDKLRKLNFKACGRDKVHSMLNKLKKQMLEEYAKEND